MAASNSAKRAKSPPTPKQVGFVKVSHAVNIVALLLMITSGLQIYNANPVFGGREGWHFPRFLLLGGWLAGGRDWHFATMWLYSVSLLAYGIFIVATQRWQRRFVSSSDLQALKTGQNPKRKAYAWHRLVYTAIVPILLLAIVTGLAMYKPAQLHWLAGLFGSWQNLRVVHFLTVPIVLSFAIVHSLLALKVGGTRLVRSIFLR